MGKDQDIRLNIEAQGAEQTSAQVGKVDAAQKGLTDQTKEAKKPTEELDTATKKLTATEETYTTLLSRIHPALGAMADVMVKGSRVAGDLATKKITLREVTDKLAGAVRANWKALTLFASIGGVIAGIAAIGAAVRAMKQEWDDAREAIKNYQDALNELKGAEQERQQAIEDISDVRRGGGMTADQARRAAQTAEAVALQFPQIQDTAINRVAGLLGERLSRGQMAQAAILVQQGRVELRPEMTAESMMRRLDRAMERYGENVERFIEREVTQQGESLQEAVKQATATTGATLDLRRRIEEILGPGVDVEGVLEDVRIFGTLGAIDGAKVTPHLYGVPFVRERYRVETPEPQGWLGVPWTIMTEQRIDEVMRVLNAISRELEQPRTTNIMPRFTYPDAHSQRRNTVNGQTYRARIGDG